VPFVGLFSGREVRKFEGRIASAFPLPFVIVLRVSRRANWKSQTKRSFVNAACVSEAVEERTASSPHLAMGKR